ncbi:type III toxin-antitoxin system ToxN/AbiQ family toxin, partial [Lachnospiraceae bacterium 56-18]
MSIKLYEVNPKYIDYLIPYAPHLFQNKQPGQSNERKYIGIVLIVNGMNYFAPLSSFKAKHEKMKINRTVPVANSAACILMYTISCFYPFM